jgi:hypothetical protein
MVSPHYNHSKSPTFHRPLLISQKPQIFRFEAFVDSSKVSKELCRFNTSFPTGINRNNHILLSFITLKV